MAKEIRVNLPFDVIDIGLHPDFPQDGEMDVLAKVRQAFRAAANEAGFEETGCGFGVRDGTDGEADIGLMVDGRHVEVRIYLPKDRPNDG